MAKYFTIEQLGGGDGPYFYRVSDVRAILTAHPEIETVQRWWWSGNDLIDCEDIPRAEIMTTKARKLQSGMTAQWANQHGFK